MKPSSIFMPRYLYLLVNWMFCIGDFHFSLCFMIYMRFDLPWSLLISNSCVVVHFSTSEMILLAMLRFTNFSSRSSAYARIPASKNSFMSELSLKSSTYLA